MPPPLDHPPPTQAEGLLLHRRLCEKVATAPFELIRAYLPFLLAALARAHPRVGPDERQQAAHDSLLTLVKNPQSYDPSRGELAAYLRMSAAGDLCNLLRAERRHHRGRVPWEAVEDSPPAGKYQGAGHEPAGQVLDRVVEGAGLSVPDREVVRLMREGEHHTGPFAAALGLGHLPAGEQARAVKRAKDRVMKRLQRRGGGHE